MKTWWISSFHLSLQRKKNPSWKRCPQISLRNTLSLVNTLHSRSGDGAYLKPPRFPSLFFQNSMDQFWPFLDILPPRVPCNKAKLSWFHGWRSDRCADLRADGIKKLHFWFIFYNSTDKCKLQNFLRIENRTIISWDMGTFVQEGQILHKTTLKNMSFNFFFQPTDRLETIQIGKNILFHNFFFFIFDRPTALERLEKNLPSVKSTERGLSDIDNSIWSNHLAKLQNWRSS